MNKLNVLLSFIIICCPLFAENNPQADPAAIVQSGNMRFTVLTPEMIRIEWSASNQFEDRASFVVINRRLPVPGYTVREENGYLYITTDKLVLRYKTGAFPVTDNLNNPHLQITLQVNGREEVWYPGKYDPYNLKGTTRTLDEANGDVRNWLEDGLISRSGWAVIDELQPRNDGSLSLMFDGSEGVDWVAQRTDKESFDRYFLGYGHDYKKALYDFTQIAGKIPMPPLYAFGYWYSKYQRYTEQDFKDIVNEIKANDIPVDVMVVDMDWHLNGKTGGTGNTEWTGWTWNPTLFPNPEEFLSWLHNQNLKTTLNLHPADGVNFPSLAFQPYFTATASNVGYGYWSHDIGGHIQQGENNPELYLRWIQFIRAKVRLQKCLFNGLTGLNCWQRNLRNHSKSKERKECGITMRSHKKLSWTYRRNRAIKH
ncbi:hypothetical protein FACS189413_04530 [Bacteroidia bacterium]|nr:hypothetical protein FACS189413_04530 [Bacteroidia bacterium]